MDFDQALELTVFNEACITSRIMAELDPPDREKLLAALADSEHVSNARIAKALILMGHPVSEGSIRNHRNGLCRC